MTQTIAIIDYGSGNLRSAAKAFEYVIAQNNFDARVIVSSQADDIAKADRLVLPGQGAFGDCMSGLKSVDGMIETLEERVIKQAAPFFGICVGMQLMATNGLEHGNHDGLNWIPGTVKPIQLSDPSLKIPHMGWNVVHCANSERFEETGKTPNPVLQSIIKSPENAPIHFYFVHSYMVECKDAVHALAYADYGGPITAIIGRDNMIGTQFHPEKSHDAGLQLITDFMNWAP